MRVIGAIVLLSGSWPLWRALTGHESLDAGGVVMVFTGLALLSGRRWTRALGVEEGAFAGLCLTNGIALAAWGTFVLVAHGELASAHLDLPVHALTSPLLFLGSGALLIVAGLRRARALLRGPGDGNGAPPPQPGGDESDCPDSTTHSRTRGDHTSAGQPAHCRDDRGSRHRVKTRAAPRSASQMKWTAGSFVP